MVPETVKFGVIGGSGLYNMPEVTDKTRIHIDTPYGSPSDDVVLGTLRGKRVAFIPRHGEGHRHTPTTVPYRANIYALKALGVRFCISANACGSLKEELHPGELVIPDQLYDNTKSERGGRSFFDEGLVAHISVADPFCNDLRQVMHSASDNVEATVHDGGTFIIIEGPRFSTRGESLAYKQLGFSIIGMTSCPEAFLAREAEISYATLAHITDYDVWRIGEEVSTQKVLEIVQSNVSKVQQIIANTIEMLDEDAVFASHTALDHAIMTAPAKQSPDEIQRLEPILRRLLSH